MGNKENMPLSELKTDSLSLFLFSLRQGFSVQPRLAWNSQRSTCPCLPSAGIKGVCCCCCMHVYTHTHAHSCILGQQTIGFPETKIRSLYAFFMLAQCLGKGGIKKIIFKTLSLMTSLIMTQILIKARELPQTE